MNQYLLAGDLGGTKTLLQLLASHGGQYQVLFGQRYNSGDFADFSTMLAQFLAAAHKLHAFHSVKVLSLAIAGPVMPRQARVTNLGWHIDADELEQVFDIARVILINDFSAVGYGLSMLGDHDLFVLQPGQEERGATRVVIGAGTGLGEGYLVWRNGDYEPLSSEGGHVDYAPQNEIQMELLRYLQTRFGHVSCERVVSGGGLVNIYDFLASRHTVGAALQAAMAAAEDKAAVLSEFAINKKDELAMEALNIFIASYGAQAGNLALTCMARGGVYIAGGIAPKMRDRMREGDFMRAFLAKGRFASLMQTLPVRLVLNPDTGLLGAVRVALRAV